MPPVLRHSFLYSITLVLITALTYFLLSELCKDHIHGWFFRFDMEKQLKLEEKRIDRAEHELKQLIISNWSPPLGSTKPKFCIGMIASNRTRRYALPCVAAILRQLNLKQWKDIHFVLAYGSVPQDLSLFQQLNLSTLQLTAFKLPRRANSYLHLNEWHRKETSDYLELMRYCIARESNYTIILQEDALAGKEFWQQIQAALTDTRLLERDDWLILKLYFGEDVHDWSAQPFWAREWLVLAAAAAITALLVEYVAARACLPRGHRGRVRRVQRLMALTYQFILNRPFGQAYKSPLPLHSLFLFSSICV